MDSKKRILEAARTKVRASENETTRNIYFHPDLTRIQRNEVFARRESRRLLTRILNKQLSALSPENDVILVTASKLIKAVTNYQKVSQALESFDVEERHMSMMETDCPNVKVIHKAVASLDPEKHVLKMSDGTDVTYNQLCICTGGKPKVIAPGNPYVIGIRDTESVKEFQKRLTDARRILVIGNGGIATELVYEIEGCEVIWAIKDKSITSTFVDAGAATFFLPQLNEEKGVKEKPMKRWKYAHAEDNMADNQGTKITTDSRPTGSALGPDWMEDLHMRGVEKACHQVHVEYQVEVERILSREEFLALATQENHPPNFNTRHISSWPVYVQLTNKAIYGCDFVVSATGVVPNTDPFIHNKFELSEDGGIKVNNKMQTSIPDVYAAGDVCDASWEHAPHWLQMRLWIQARQMGAYAAKCMVAKVKQEDIPMDFCFELFAHVTKFFNYKVILLGKFNAQGLGADHELLLRVTKGVEYVKAVIQGGRMHGVILVGETDLEETFENLILNQTDITPFKDHLLDPNIDIEDFFD